MMHRLTAFAALTAASAIVAAGPAFAHAHLVSSNPAANAVLTAAPKTITLTFNEKLVPAFSKFELVMVDHNAKAPVKTAVSQDGKTISGAPQSALMKGSYKIVWIAASADGHKMNGEVAFKVG